MVSVQRLLNGLTHYRTMPVSNGAILKEVIQTNNSTFSHTPVCSGFALRVHSVKTNTSLSKFILGRKFTFKEESTLSY